MAHAAYLLCWACIGFLLLRESRRRPNVSAATWIPTLMVLALSTRTPMGWIASLQIPQFSGLANESSGNLLDQSFFASLIAASLIISSVRGTSWGRVFATNAALMVLYAYFTLSVLWSPTLSDSLIRVIKDFGCTVIVIAVLWSEKEPQEAIRAVYVRCACVLIPLSAVLVMFSQMGKGYSNDGLVIYVGAGLTKNSFGEFLLISIIFLVWDHLERRFATGATPLWRGMPWDHVVLVIMGFWLLNLSQSKTSLVSVIIGLALILGAGRLASSSISRLIFALALSYPLLALGMQNLTPVFGPVLEMLGRDATFTGRSNIWQHITLDTVNPLIGTGFWNFWGGAGGRAVDRAMQTDVPNAHDGYLDIYLDGGLIGVFLLVCVLVACGRRIIKRLPVDRFSRLQYAFLIVAIIHNVTESSFARLSGLWFTIVLALIEFPPRNINETAPLDPPRLNFRNTGAKLAQPKTERFVKQPI